jgi:hypothetical protein
MKVITKSPILINPEATYSSLDGSSNKEEIKAFQKWVWYTKGDKSLKTSKAPDGVDGIWGAKTGSAWSKYSTEFQKTLPILGVQNITAEAEKLKAEAEAEALRLKAIADADALKVKDGEKGSGKPSWWKNRTKTQKRLIIGGALVVTGLTIMLIVRSVKKSKAK